MSGRLEPRSKHRHDPALDRYKKARQDMHPRFEPSSRRSTELLLVQLLSTQKGHGALLSTLILMSSEWSLEKIERGRAQTEAQMMSAQMSRRLRSSQYLHFSTSLVRVCIMDFLIHVRLMYPLMFLELTTMERA